MRARAKKKKISRCARKILSLGKEIREATSTKYKLLVCAEPSHFKSLSLMPSQNAQKRGLTEKEREK